MKFLGRILLIATAALLLEALGFAQYNGLASDKSGVDVFQTNTSNQYGDYVFATADPQFMKEAAQDAMAKIHLAYLALQNAQNEQVKAFARQILADYSKAQGGLFNIANRQAVVLPSTLDSKNLDAFEALSQLQGAEFDKAYMKAMVNGDQTATSRFKQEATRGDGWAGHTLPTLESNLKEAQKVALAVGVRSAVSEEHSTSSASKPGNE